MGCGWRINERNHKMNLFRDLILFHSFFCVAVCIITVSSLYQSILIKLELLDHTPAPLLSIIKSHRSKRQYLSTNWPLYSLVEAA